MKKVPDIEDEPDATALNSTRDDSAVRRLRIFGTILFWVGFGGGILLAVAARLLGREGLVVLVPILALLFIALAWVGLKTLHRARQLVARPGDLALRDDARPPVLYLRAFEQDSASARAMSTLGNFRYFTEEEQLATALRDIGPFIAIGEPGEALPDLGADRIYVEGDWQTKVSDLMDRARLLVLRAANTDGFLWEFRTAIQRLDPGRLLLIIPHGRRQYEEFVRRAGDVLPQPLPAYPRRKHRIGNIRGFVSFGPGWKPELLPVKRSFLRARFKSPFVSRSKLTLKPIFDRLEVPWNPPPIAKGRMTVLAVFGVVLSLAVFVLATLTFPAFDRFISSIILPTSSEDERRTDRFRPPLPPLVKAPELEAQDPYDAVVARIGQVLVSSPEVAAAFADTPRDQVRARAAQLSSLGMRRLDGETLVRRARLMSELLNVADTTECASISRGDPAAIHSVLRRLDAATIEGWFEVARGAMLAEARGTPFAIPYDEARFVESFQVLVAALPEQQVDRFTQTLIDPVSAADEDTCWTARTLHLGLLRLGEPHRTVLARSLVEP